jgi:gas vesicle protein
MFKENSNIIKASCFLLGTVAGSLTTFLFSTHGGKVFRKILRNDTVLMWENIENKSRDIFYSVDTSIRHIYKKALRSVDMEVRSIAAGINAAFKSMLKNDSSNDFIVDITQDFFWDDDLEITYGSENFPKQEGMRRRRDHKRFS